jgi:hypothetical protein
MSNNMNKEVKGCAPQEPCTLTQQLTITSALEGLEYEVRQLSELKEYSKVLNNKLERHEVLNDTEPLMLDLEGKTIPEIMHMLVVEINIQTNLIRVNIERAIDIIE